MLLYIVRHGESEGNLSDDFTGHTNVQLTQKGVEQAQATAEYLADVDFAAIYSSDLDRAYDTAVPHAAIHNLPINKTDQLREIYGGAWEGVTYGKIAELFPDDAKNYLMDLGNARPTNGESIPEMAWRMHAAMTKIGEAHPDQNVLVTTHALALRGYLALVKGIPLADFNKTEYVSNASVTIISYVNGKFTLITEGYDEHLGALITKLPKDV